MKEVSEGFYLFFTALAMQIVGHAESGGCHMETVVPICMHRAGLVIGGLNPHRLGVGGKASSSKVSAC